MLLMLYYLNSFLILHAIILIFNVLTFFINFIVFENYDIFFLFIFDSIFLKVYANFI